MIFYEFEEWASLTCQNELVIAVSIHINVLYIFAQGGATRDPPDQHQEGLSGPNTNQAAPLIPVPAIVKVSHS